MTDDEALMTASAIDEGFNTVAAMQLLADAASLYDLRDNVGTDVLLEQAADIAVRMRAKVRARVQQEAQS